MKKVSARELAKILEEGLPGEVCVEQHIINYYFGRYYSVVLKGKDLLVSKIEKVLKKHGIKIVRFFNDKRKDYRRIKIVDWERCIPRDDSKPFTSVIFKVAEKDADKVQEFLVSHEIKAKVTKIK